MSKTFKEIFTAESEGPTSFLTQYLSSWAAVELSPLVNPELDDTFIKRIYHMLYAKYANSQIVGTDETQWLERFWLVLYEFAPAYQRKYNVQKTLRTMDDDDLIKGAVQKTTHGYNPSTDISGNTDTEISTVNEQNLMKYTKGKLNGYNELLLLLKTDVTDQFVNKFRDLFVKVPLKNYWSDDND